MTEQEAKTKWCPYANAEAVPHERLPEGSTDVTEAHARCIGSACMAWGWLDGFRCEGYCGLARRP